ncbi:metabolite traffic protein EboE [Aurantibacter crassamenti]|uniref:metabolite traffic protein EboE n=1 Tax=Aurantibacter crassamenti TaxID=1837375 RepID=UPI0019393F90|nr:metabolite traffic protein EboE [Aurantibacter crassamenti]MBM1107851.1 metabolite traffic protein EboE [Aurantibacter crassamenti]
MKVNNTFHLSYCTNIHPGSNWESTFTSLKEYVPGIKSKVSPNESFGLGLRLSNKASEELNEGNNFTQFTDWLSQNDLYVFTMNGFPYGNFHDERVKDDVHTPDWTTPERLIYTKRLFNQLSKLLPEGMSGGISTSPISYKYWHKSEEETKKAFKVGAEQLAEIILQLLDIENNTGKYLHLDMEPEPDGLLENSDEVLDFFDTYLVPIASEILRARTDIEDQKLEEVIKRYITVCYDICHFSLAFEEPEETFKKFADAGLNIGKIQVSAALKILYTEADADEIWNSLARFDEPTYLHQVTEQIDGKVKTYNDLPIVLESRKEFTEMRAHFHVPIFLEQFGKLFSTQDHILKVVEHLKTNPVSDHLEIETYTWDVLPKELKRDLSESIIREIEWLKERL